MPACKRLVTVRAMCHELLALVLGDKVSMQVVTVVKAFMTLGAVIQVDGGSDTGRRRLRAASGGVLGGYSCV